ncbi:hypothetical protein NLX67_10975 [Domibacillus sp. A3M-37]|uniref:hypothetical protein n=1 Tax=Domibacillus TaxID=1433999 RepID=UPI000617D6E1|nr:MULTISPECIES: hypothetical protein [Domibacillus]MCP3762910.1 hypothetical protein [Domibacillus sp. A3M-37]
MREMNLTDVTKRIADRRPAVDQQILKDRGQERLIKRRPRDPNEAAVLDQLCIERWKKAEAAGKIKYLSKREWYYELD